MTEQATPLFHIANHESDLVFYSSLVEQWRDLLRSGQWDSTPHARELQPFNFFGQRVLWTLSGPGRPVGTLEVFRTALFTARRFTVRELIGCLSLLVEVY